jgi:hypothetical protein
VDGETCRGGRDPLRARRQYRWVNHVKAAIGHCRPDEVTVGILKSLIDDKLANPHAPAKKKVGKLSAASLRLVIRLVSTFYSDLVDDGLATQNPAKMLPKKTRKLLKPTHDPKKTPFLETKEDFGLARPAHFDGVTSTSRNSCSTSANRSRVRQKTRMAGRFQCRAGFTNC